MLKHSLSTLLALPLLAQPLAKPQPVPAAPSPAPLSVPPAPAAPTYTPETVLARIGTQVYREKDFHAFLKAMAGARQAESLLKNPGSLANLRQRYLDTLLFAAEARKQGLQKSEDYKEMIKLQEDQVLVRLLMAEDREGSVGTKLKAQAENPSQEDMLAFFEKNKQRYETPERFTARHIRVATKRTGTPDEQKASETEAQAKLVKIQEELKAGKTFEAVAKEFTEDLSSKATGGLIKESPYNRYAKEFEEAVRKQEIGKVGEPVKTDLGFELILVEARLDKQPGVFENVKDRVKQQMVPERREAALKAFMEEAKKNVGYVTGPEAEKDVPAAKPSKKAAPKKK